MIDAWLHDEKNVDIESKEDCLNSTQLFSTIFHIGKNFYFDKIGEEIGITFTSPRPGTVVGIHTYEMDLKIHREKTVI
jgi:hypothetical protein